MVFICIWAFRYNSFQYPFSGFFLFFRMVFRSLPPISQSFNIHFQDSSFSSSDSNILYLTDDTGFQYPFSGFFLFFLSSNQNLYFLRSRLSISIFRILPFLPKQLYHPKVLFPYFQYPFSGFFLFFGDYPLTGLTNSWSFNIHFQDSSFSSWLQCSGWYLEFELSISIFRILPFLLFFYIISMQTGYIFQYPFSGFFLFFIQYVVTDIDIPKHFQYPFSGFFLFFLLQYQWWRGPIIILSISIFRILPFLRQHQMQ